MNRTPVTRVRKPYSCPKLQVYGDIRTITLTGGTGSFDVVPSPRSAGKHSTHH